ncbi:MAG: hypothetical protein WCD57_18925 [Acidobacteriaceae bacterium]
MSLLPHDGHGDVGVPDRGGIAEPETGWIANGDGAYDESGFNSFASATAITSVCIEREWV